MTTNKQLLCVLPSDVMAQIANIETQIFSSIYSFYSNGMKCFASNEWLAKNIGTSLRCVERALQSLKDKNLIRTYFLNGRRQLEPTAQKSSNTASFFKKPSSARTANQNNNCTDSYGVKIPRLIQNLFKDLTIEGSVKEEIVQEEIIVQPELPVDQTDKNVGQPTDKNVGHNIYKANIINNTTTERSGLKPKSGFFKKKSVVVFSEDQKNYLKLRLSQIPPELVPYIPQEEWIDQIHYKIEREYSHDVRLGINCCLKICREYGWGTPPGYGSSSIPAKAIVPMAIDEKAQDRLHFSKLLKRAKDMGNAPQGLLDNLERLSTTSVGAHCA